MLASNESANGHIEVWAKPSTEAQEKTTARRKPLSEDVETALQILESEAERTHRYRQSLEDARAVVRFTQRVSSDDELLQIVDQIERVLEDGAEE